MLRYPLRIALLLCTAVTASVIETTKGENRTTYSTAVHCLHPSLSSQKLNRTSLIDFLVDKWWVPRARLRYTGMIPEDIYFGTQYETVTAVNNGTTGEALYFQCPSEPSSSGAEHGGVNATVRQQWCWTLPAFAPLPAHWNVTTKEIESQRTLVYPILFYATHDSDGPDTGTYTYHESYHRIMAIDEKYMVLRLVRERMVREFVEPDGSVIALVANDQEVVDGQWIYRKASPEFNARVKIQVETERKEARERWRASREK